MIRVRRLAQRLAPKLVLLLSFSGVAGALPVQQATVPDLMLDSETKSVDKCLAELADLGEEWSWSAVVVQSIDPKTDVSERPVLMQHPSPGTLIDPGQAMHLVISPLGGGISVYVVVWAVVATVGWIWTLIAKSRKTA